jgi:hypothetical protein
MLLPLIRRSILVVVALAISACSSSSGDGGSTGSTILGMALSANDNTLYVANADKQVVQALNLTTLAVTTYAGAAGMAGSVNGAGTVARFYEPYALVNVGGSLFVADTYNQGIRKIDASQAVTTLAGKLGYVGATDDTGVAALFNFPKGITAVGTDVYVADTSNYLIRKVDALGVVTTFAGSSGSSGYVDGTSGVKFGAPFAVAADATYVYVSDSANNSIRSVKISDGTVATVAGSTSGVSGTTDAAGTAARFNTPAGIVSDGVNTLYVADSGNNTIRQIDVSTTPATVTTIAGLSGTAGSSDGTGTASAKFNTPVGLALNAAGTILYVSDQNYTKVRKIVLSTGAVTTLNASF